MRRLVTTLLAAVAFLVLLAAPDAIFAPKANGFPAAAFKAVVPVVQDTAVLADTAIVSIASELFDVRGGGVASQDLAFPAFADTARGRNFVEQGHGLTLSAKRSRFVKRPRHDPG